MKGTYVNWGAPAPRNNALEIIYMGDWKEGEMLKKYTQKSQKSQCCDLLSFWGRRVGFSRM